MAATSNQTLPTDTTVGGQCVIERHLRNGVMTEVYRARREGSGRERFEVRRFTLVASNDALRVVRRELDRIQKLGLAAVPALVDVIDDPVGLLVVTAASEGSTSLRVTLDAAGSLEPAECVRVVRVVARVLDALHGASPPVLHRRLSPDTITLAGPDHDVRVEECGLAQALVEAALVNARVPLQARQYLSPDELLQRPSPRGDVFALASVAFECITGRAAFQGATEASLSAAILRGVRPSASALRPEIPKAVDGVLSRAWSAEASKAFASASAMAEALAGAMGTVAAAPAKPAAPAIGSPPAGTPVLTANELNMMKSTILGVGSLSSRPPGMAPRAKAHDPERAALEATIAANPAKPKMVGGRPQMPTQKVEVPRIHPPGTERVSDEAERPTFPPARLPPAAPAPKVGPSEPGARNDLFNIADIEGLDIPLAAEGTPVSGRPLPRVSSVPPPVPKVPSRSPTILRASAPPPDPEPPSSSSEVTFEMDAEIPASLVDGEEDSWEVPAAPARPASMPSLPKVSAPAPAPEPAAAADPELEIEAEPEPEPEPDPEPSLPAFVIPPDVQAVPEPVRAAPAPAEYIPSWAPVSPEPVLDPVSIPPPIAPSLAPPDPGRFVSVRPPEPSAFVPPPPPPPPANLAKVKILGASIVAAAAIVTGGQIYLARMQRAPVPRLPPAVLVPAPVPQPPVPATPTVADASVVARDAGALAVADVAVVTDVPAVLAVADAAAGTDAGAVARVNVTVDASTAANPAVAWNVEVFGAANDPPRAHPRRRDMSGLEEALEPSVRRCVGTASSRHVRMTVVYAGTTGRPTEVRIAGVYAQPPVGQCLENLMRSNPIPPFTDEDFESNFVFNTTDEEEE